MKSATRPRSARPEADQWTDSDGLSAPQRYWSLAAIWITIVMAILDSTIVNVALPTIAVDLGTTAAVSIWVINAYQIAISMFLLSFAALGEIVSCKKVYLAGVCAFVVASLACALTDSITMLSLARFIQGLGAAAILALNGALVRHTFPKAMLGRGLGYNAMVVALAAASGPTLAAVILSFASWRWLFAVNIPTGLLALLIGWRFLPNTPRSDRVFEYGAAFLTACFFAGVFLVASDTAHGSASFRTVGIALATFACAVLIWRSSRDQREPLVPFDLMRVRVLRLSYATSICAFAGQMIGLIALPFFLQERLGLGHFQTGLMITALPCGVAVAAPLAGRLTERVSPALLGGIGLCLLSLGYAAMAIMSVFHSTALVVLPTAVCGFGFGLFQSPNNRTMLGSVPLRRSGAAAGMLATARLVGQTLGAICVALLFRVAGSTSAIPFVAAALCGAIAAVLSVRRIAPMN